MKKVLKQIGVILICCIMILSSITFNVFADTTHQVTVNQAPFVSYERIINSTFKTGTKDFTIGDGIGKVIFNLNVDDGWKQIKVTDSKDNVLYTANVVEALEPANDGSNSYYFGFPAKNIPKIGDEVLTLSVEYPDGYVFSQSYNVNTYPMYAFYANDMDDTEKLDLAGLNLYNGNKKDAVDYKGTATISGGFSGKSSSDKAVTVESLKSGSKLLRYYSNNAVTSFDGDHVIEYDTYHKNKMKLLLKLHGKDSGITKNTTTFETLNTYNNMWYTVRYTFSGNTVKAEAVKDGAVVATLLNETWTSEENPNFYNNGLPSLTGAQLNYYDSSNVESSRVYAFDNYKFMKKIKTDSQISYVDDDTVVSVDDGDISVSADSIIINMDSSFVDLTGAVLKKEGTIVDKNIVTNANTVTIEDSLDAGAYTLVIPATAKVAATTDATLDIGGSIEIPFNVVDPAVALLAAASITVNNNNIGKVMTVATDYAEGCTSANLYFEDTKVGSVLENKKARISLADGIVAGNYTLRLELTYPELNTPISKYQSVKIYGEYDPIGASVIDFERITPQVYESSETALSDIKSLQNVRSIIYKDNAGTVEIASDSDHGNTFKINANQEMLASQAYFCAYANPKISETGEATNSPISSGKAVISFDVWISSADDITQLIIIPYDDVNSTTKRFDPFTTLVFENKILGESEVEEGWYNITFVTDINNKRYSGIITSESGETWKIPNTSFAAQEGATKISYYRIGARIAKGKSFAFDNIKTGCMESDILKSTDYVKSGIVCSAPGVIPYNADSVKLNVSKVYALTNGDVTLSVNGEVAEVVSATYADGAISVPLTGVKEGDKLTITVSADAMADGSMVDVPVVAELVAGDENGSAIVVADGRASAVFGISAGEELSAIGYIAVYDNQELVALQSTNISIKAGTDSYTLKRVVLPASCSSVKAFVWDEVTPIMPLKEYINNK